MNGNVFTTPINALVVKPFKLVYMFTLGGDIVVDDKVECEFFRTNPPSHQCVEGDCYKGNTKRTEAFGNCCMRCPKAMRCLESCNKADRLKFSIKEAGTHG